MQPFLYGRVLSVHAHMYGIAPRNAYLSVGFSSVAILRTWMSKGIFPCRHSSTRTLFVRHFVHHIGCMNTWKNVFFGGHRCCVVQDRYTGIARGKRNECHKMHILGTERNFVYANEWYEYHWYQDRFFWPELRQWKWTLTAPMAGWCTLAATPVSISLLDKL